MSNTETMHSGGNFVLPPLSVRHLLGIAELTRHDILSIFSAARQFREELLRKDRWSDLLGGRIVMNLFFENSTRTRNSFHIAARRLGADVMNFTTEGSSVAKGETLMDTVHNLEAMGVHAFVIRHSAAGVPHFVAQRCRSVIFNAGDGRHEHPFQALGDCLTLHDHWHTAGSAADATGLEGKCVAIVGDITHGRVALSNILALKKLGANVAVCGPPTLIPRGIAELGVQVFHRLDEAIEFADALNMLRVQHERMDRGFLPSVREYARLYGLNRHRLQSLAKDLLILHPGPINRGVELDSHTADGPRSVILQQVENGVAVRMAGMALTLRG